jgi:hypothetical protein
MNSPAAVDAEQPRRRSSFAFRTVSRSGMGTSASKKFKVHTGITDGSGTRPARLHEHAKTNIETRKQGNGQARAEADGEEGQEDQTGTRRAARARKMGKMESLEI